MSHVDFLDTTALVWEDLPLTIQNKCDRYDDLVDAHEDAADNDDEEAMAKLDAQIEKIDAELLVALKEINTKSLETPVVPAKVETTPVAAPTIPAATAPVATTTATPIVKPSKDEDETDLGKTLQLGFSVKHNLYNNDDYKTDEAEDVFWEKMDDKVSELEESYCGVLDCSGIETINGKLINCVRGYASYEIEHSKGEDLITVWRNWFISEGAVCGKVERALIDHNYEG